MKFNGYTYQPNNFIIVGFQQDDLPKFSKIDEILLIGDNPLVLTTEYNTNGIMHHYHSYSITSDKIQREFHLKDIVDPRPLITHTIRDVSNYHLHISIRSTAVYA